GLAGQRALYLAPLVGLLLQRYWAGRVRPRTFYALAAAAVGLVVLVWAVNHWRFPAEMPPAYLGEMAWTWGLAGGTLLLLVAAPDRRAGAGRGPRPPRRLNAVDRRLSPAHNGDRQPASAHHHGKESRMPWCTLPTVELFYAARGAGDPVLFLNGLSGDHLY